jgi:hypothetical protein
MPPRIRFVFATLSLAMFFVAAVPLYGELFRRRDIWWTPFAMLVPLGESMDRVEIYARGKPSRLCSRPDSCGLRRKADRAHWPSTMWASVSTTGTGSESSASRCCLCTPRAVASPRACSCWS